jgi:hypothetical protein
MQLCTQFFRLCSLQLVCNPPLVGDVVHHCCNLTCTAWRLRSLAYKAD